MRKQSICILKETMYIIMRNVKVMIISPSSEVLDNSWETNYRQGLEKEKNIKIEEVNKKRWRKEHKERND
jgi:uncharacterized membrane protein YgaE (UPF0421/DUF939 family)